MARTGWVAIAAIAALAFGAFAITRDGPLTTPAGEGTVVTPAGSFQGFALPGYAARHLERPYKSYLVEVEPGIRIHVLEIGAGTPVVMLHGNPTSGFLYRKVAARLLDGPAGDGVRVIMPSLVGLGFSSKVPASWHTLENHIRWMSKTLAQLNIEGAVFVGQDWGGPIGMGALARTPGLLRGAVILNTALNAPKTRTSLSRAHDIARTPLVGELVFEVVMSIFDRLPDAQGDPSSLPPGVIDLYRRPLLESGNAKAPLAMMRMVPNSPDEPSAAQLRKIEAYIQDLTAPVEIVWGRNDPILGAGLDAMRANFPSAPVTVTAAGHFLQEEVPGEIAAAIARVIARIETGSAPAAP